jgi:hypothetical protein
VWVNVLPKYRGYAIRQEVLILDGGEATHKLVNVPTEQLPEWDRRHDISGRLIATSSSLELGTDSSSLERVNCLSEKQVV